MKAREIVKTQTTSGTLCSRERRNPKRWRDPIREGVNNFPFLLDLSARASILKSVWAVLSREPGGEELWGATEPLPALGQESMGNPVRLSPEMLRKSLCNLLCGLGQCHRERAQGH